MSTLLQERPELEIEYPDSDGEPMAENTLQFEYIVTIKEGLESLFRDDPNVFVAGDLFWYPVRGQPTIRLAPDVLFVRGRPKGHRGSYMQWREENISPQVVMEVLSPGNRSGEMARKFKFYEDYGVEEYYIYDPESGELTGWLRDNGKFREIEEMIGWVSPRLGIRFELIEGALQLFRPDGVRFLTYQEQDEARVRAEEERARAEEERARAEEERVHFEQKWIQSEQERARLEQERETIQRLAEKERRSREEDRAEIARLKAQLQAMSAGIDEPKPPGLS